MVEPERIQPLNRKPRRRGLYVLYWMQQSQRAEWNPALEYAVQEANTLGQPLVVVFGLTSRFPEANLRHYKFMLEGLRETHRALADRGVQMVVLKEPPVTAALRMAAEASTLVVDRGYLRIQRLWRQRVARRARISVVQVEGDVVVPAEIASSKEEYGARTLRPRIKRHLERFLTEFVSEPLRKDSLGLSLEEGICLDDIDSALAELKVDRSVPAVGSFRGGTSQARQLLERFVHEKLSCYRQDSGDPGLNNVSHLSPYLHFGQISPVYAALQVRQAQGVRWENVEAFLEQLVVRRELSVNFVLHNPDYDKYEGLPDWARRTLERHKIDPRAYLYTEQQFERAETHDPYWNAAQREMVATGKMHNYMRMYWAKKILEWSETPQEAFRIALALNNKYELDGRDPNSFAGVAWCFGKHDRPWAERPVFGQIRYMNAAGLERKFDMEAYLKRVPPKL
jgi:deoxyribodipyrimidine photo-lyase